jgi:hypothetical protein
VRRGGGIKLKRAVEEAFFRRLKADLGGRLAAEKGGQSAEAAPPFLLEHVRNDFQKKNGQRELAVSIKARMGAFF